MMSTELRTDRTPPDKAEDGSLFQRWSRGQRAVVDIGGRPVGENCPVFIIAEIGINHNGSLALAEKLIRGASRAGCDAVKFQKRTPELCVPRSQWEVVRKTPWGSMTYLEYKQKLEFGEREYRAIQALCRGIGIQWFASCWDQRSVEFLEAFDPPCYKVASASLTDTLLLRAIRQTGRPVILSTGMSTLAEIQAAVRVLGENRLLIAHSTSTYPCAVDELNLRMIERLGSFYPRCPIGYSGHEQGFAPTYASVALGASFVERHITLDPSMWGTDQAASLSLEALKQLVEHIRELERALGDGVKRVYASELVARQKLRQPAGVCHGGP